MACTVYLDRGVCMHEEHFGCLWDLLLQIPPIGTWLQARGINFRMKTLVLDVNFEITAASKRAAAPHYQYGSARQCIALTEHDRLLATLGQLVEVPPLYRGDHDIHVLLEALTAIKR